ncbi:MAG: MoaD family protein [Pseudomonadales bacterium]|nr:MoaD family protein [Pseudomonadales bacterium]
MAEVRVVYFASLREVVGVAEQQFEVQSLGDLLMHIRETFDCEAVRALTAENVRIAINQSLVSDIDAVPLLSAGDEIAFLPPVTGG